MKITFIKVMVSIMLIITEEASNIFLKNAWLGCNCQEINKLISVTSIMLAGKIKNCWWLASCNSPQASE